MLNEKQIQLITEISNGDISNVDIEYGICYNVKCVGGFDFCIGVYLSQFWVNWPEYSGELAFPVSGVDGYYGQNLWEGEQLRLRVSLCKFLLSCICGGEILA